MHHSQPSDIQPSQACRARGLRIGTFSPSSCGCADVLQPGSQGWAPCRQWTGCGSNACPVSRSLFHGPRPPPHRPWRLSTWWSMHGSYSWEELCSGDSHLSKTLLMHKTKRKTLPSGIFQFFPLNAWGKKIIKPLNQLPPPLKGAN